MWIDKIKAEWNENPLQIIAIATSVTIALSTVMNAVSAAQGRRAYAKQVKYRVKNRG